MTQVADKNDKYVVSIPTPAGDAIIESTGQWEEFRKMSEYIGRLRSGRVGSTNKVYVSAIISNTPQDAKRQVWRGYNTLGS